MSRNNYAFIDGQNLDKSIKEIIFPIWTDKKKCCKNKKDRRRYFNNQGLSK